MKNLKFQMIMIIALTFGFIQVSTAQIQSKGLYLTYADYLNHKLSYTENAANPGGNKIYIHEFAGMRKITVITNGKKTVLEKDKIFGYHDAYGNDYRFNDDKTYQIIDTTGFYMYSYDKLVQQGKGPKPTRVYFFSKKADGALVPLTLKNIARAFPENPKFREMVEVASVNNVKPDAYDNEANVYKIKELYIASLK